MYGYLKNLDFTKISSTFMTIRSSGLILFGEFFLLITLSSERSRVKEAEVVEGADLLIEGARISDISQIVRSEYA